MKKRELNLEILELKQMENKQAAVSLMPCPCGASGGGICGVGWTILGLFLGEARSNVRDGTVPDPLGVPCTGSLDSTGGTCGTDADFGGINADIDGNPDAW